MGIIIFVNAVFVGAEIELDIRDSQKFRRLVRNLEQFFVLTYAVELLIRWFGRQIGRSWKLFWTPWIIFDAIVLAVGLLTIVIAEMMPRYVVILRVLRLLRLVRVVRRVMLPLWKLVDGAFQALPLLLYSLMMLIGVSYPFACLIGEVV